MHRAIQKFISVFCFTLIFSSFSYLYALEPENLAQVKQKLIQYHDSGAYEEDQARVIKKAMNWLNLRTNQKKSTSEKLALVLDIDETSLSNYPNMKAEDFGGSLKEIRDLENRASDLPIKATKELYDFALSKHVSVFFLTGRAEEDRAVTEKNLRQAGYIAWEKLILRKADQHQLPAADYKTAERKRIAALGYTIIENIGDQDSDLRGGISEKSFKLPNPYYFIP